MEPKKQNEWRRKLNAKTEMLRRNGPVIKSRKSVESVLRVEARMVGKICKRGRC